MKKMFARKMDETNFWEELRSEWWAYAKKNKLTMYEKVNGVEGETNEGEVNKNQTIDCDIEDKDDSLECQDDQVSKLKHLMITGLKISGKNMIIPTMVMLHLSIMLKRGKI